MLKKLKRNLAGNLFMVKICFENVYYYSYIGDVFRAPKAGMLLSVLAGVGLQVP